MRASCDRVRRRRDACAVRSIAASGFFCIFQSPRRVVVAQAHTHTPEDEDARARIRPSRFDSRLFGKAVCARRRRRRRRRRRVGRVGREVRIDANMTMRRRCGGVPGAAPPSRARASVADAIRAPSRRWASYLARARAMGGRRGVGGARARDDAVGCARKILGRCAARVTARDARAWRRRETRMSRAG